MRELYSVTYEDPCEEYLYPPEANEEASPDEAQVEGAGAYKLPIYCKTCKSSDLISRAFLGDKVLNGSVICVIAIVSETELALHREEGSDDDPTDNTLIYSSLNDDKLLIPKFYNYDPKDNEYFRHLQNSQYFRQSYLPSNKNSTLAVNAPDLATFASNLKEAGGVFNPGEYLSAAGAVLVEQILVPHLLTYSGIKFISHVSEQFGLRYEEQVTADRACGSTNLEVLEGKSDTEIKELITIQNKGWGCNSCPVEEIYFSALTIVGKNSLPGTSELIIEGTYLQRMCLNDSNPVF